jgi:hypothetical protein
VLAKHYRLNSVVASYFCKICIRLATSRSVIIIWVAASWMKISYDWSPAKRKLLINFDILYPAGR